MEMIFDDLISNVAQKIKSFEILAKFQTIQFFFEFFSYISNQVVKNHLHGAIG